MAFLCPNPSNTSMQLAIIPALPIPPLQWQSVFPFKLVRIFFTYSILSGAAPSKIGKDIKLILSFSQIYLYFSRSTPSVFNSYRFSKHSILLTGKLSTSFLRSRKIGLPSLDIANLLPGH